MVVELSVREQEEARRWERRFATQLRPARQEEIRNELEVFLRFVAEQSARVDLREWTALREHARSALDLAASDGGRTSQQVLAVVRDTTVRQYDGSYAAQTLFYAARALEVEQAAIDRRAEQFRSQYGIDPRAIRQENIRPGVVPSPALARAPSTNEASVPVMQPLAQPVPAAPEASSSLIQPVESPAAPVAPSLAQPVATPAAPAPRTRPPSEAATGRYHETLAALNAARERFNGNEYTALTAVTLDSRAYTAALNTKLLASSAAGRAIGNQQGLTLAARNALGSFADGTGNQPPEAFQRLSEADQNLVMAARSSISAEREQARLLDDRAAALARQHLPDMSETQITEMRTRMQGNHSDDRRMTTFAGAIMDRIQAMAAGVRADVTAAEEAHHAAAQDYINSQFVPPPGVQPEAVRAAVGRNTTMNGTIGNLSTGTSVASNAPGGLGGPPARG